MSLAVDFQGAGRGARRMAALHAAARSHSSAGLRLHRSPRVSYCTVEAGFLLCVMEIASVITNERIEENVLLSWVSQSHFGSFALGTSLPQKRRAPQVT
ncbi:hypothetical protein GN956_G19294 [Arapaima gigas]